MGLVINKFCNILDQSLQSRYPFGHLHSNMKEALYAKKSWRSSGLVSFKLEETALVEKVLLPSSKILTIGISRITTIMQSSYLVLFLEYQLNLLRHVIYIIRGWETMADGLNPISQPVYVYIARDLRMVFTFING